MNYRIVFFIVFAFISIPLQADSLKNSPGDFRKAQTGYSFSFPRDHGAHEEYQTEWWYFTGHLQNAQGRKFGFQWTVFRIGLLPPQISLPAAASAWRTRQVFLGHLAISDLNSKKFHYCEAASREVLKIAKASTEKFELYLPHFQGKSGDSSDLTLESHFDDLGLNLNLKLPPQSILHGDKGYSAKAAEAGHASYYYSLAPIATQGEIQIGNEKFTVEGKAWMDHEFGSGFLQKDQRGWDWLSLPFEDGSSLMLFQVRDRRGEDHNFVSGTFISAEGKSTALNATEIRLTPGQRWKSPRSKANYPIEWQVSIPKLKMDLQIRASFPEQELITSQSTQVTYWEGSVEIQGSHEGKSIQSMGYLEMTGYAEGGVLGVTE